jgi:hypothetical protein
MWFINVFVGSYAIFTMYKIVKYLAVMMKSQEKFEKLGVKREKLYNMQVSQFLFSICVLVMFLLADIWAMSYYTKHALALLEFFFYIFDTAVIYLIGSELDRVKFYNDEILTTNKK